MARKAYKLSPLQLFGSLALAGLAGAGLANLLSSNESGSNNNNTNTNNTNTNDENKNGNEKKYSIGNQVDRYNLAKATNNIRYLEMEKVFDGTSFKGKRVLVIGGSRGLGLSIVKELVACGAETLATVRKSCDALESLPNLHKIISNVDVTKLDTIKNDLVNGLDNKAIDILIVNAGYFYGPVETCLNPNTINFEEEMKMIDICGMGPLRVINVLTNNGLIKEKNGKIAIITSQAGSIAWREEQNRHGDNYGHHASRAVTNMIGRLLSFELGDKIGVPVVLLHPGFNRTDMTSKYAAIWDKEGAVDASIGAKRVLYEINRLKMANTGSFINCEDGLHIPW